MFTSAPAVINSFTASMFPSSAANIRAVRPASCNVEKCLDIELGIEQSGILTRANINECKTLCRYEFAVALFPGSLCVLQVMRGPVNKAVFAISGVQSCSDTSSRLDPAILMGLT